MYKEKLTLVSIVFHGKRTSVFLTAKVQGNKTIIPAAEMKRLYQIAGIPNLRGLTITIG